MLRLFVDNLLPVLLVAGAGYLLAWRMRVDPRPVAHLAFFVLAPCLIFDAITHSEVPGDAVLRMVAFAATTLIALAAVAFVAARLFGWSRSLVSAVVLVVLLPNAANLGLSINLFAFGEKGMALATVFFVTSAVLTYTLGIVVASLGRASLIATLAGLPKVPAIWAVVVAFVSVNAGWSLPTPMERSIGLLADACIPVFLVILGMQLYGKGLRARPGPLALAAGMRLLGGAAVALVLAVPFGLEGVARQAGVLQAGMPSAVVCMILATEYDVEPAFVTSVVFLTTLLGPLTLTPLMYLLGA